MAVGLDGGHQVGGLLATLVSWLVEIVHVEGSIVPAGLADEDGRVPAVAGVRARDDQLVVDGREAAAARSFGAATHERVVSSVWPTAVRTEREL
eukprot:SAG31_NODE_15424_length_756_cov_0.829528_1_plen_94_part_00